MREEECAGADLETEGRALRREVEAIEEMAPKASTARLPEGDRAL
jgi:hypothetical protein